VTKELNKDTECCTVQHTIVT